MSGLPFERADASSEYVGVRTIMEIDSSYSSFISSVRAAGWSMNENVHATLYVQYGTVALLVDHNVISTLCGGQRGKARHAQAAAQRSTPQGLPDGARAPVPHHFQTLGEAEQAVEPEATAAAAGARGNRWAGAAATDDECADGSRRRVVTRRRHGPRRASEAHARSSYIGSRLAGNATRETLSGHSARHAASL